MLQLNNYDEPTVTEELELSVFDHLKDPNTQEYLQLKALEVSLSIAELAPYDDDASVTERHLLAGELRAFSKLIFKEDTP